MRDPCQDPCEGQRDPGCGWTTLGQRHRGRSSAWDKLGNVEMLCAGSCGTRAVPEQASPGVPGMATQCPQGHPNAAASPLLPQAPNPARGAQGWTSYPSTPRDALGDAQLASQDLGLQLASLPNSCLAPQRGCPSPGQQTEWGQWVAAVRAGSPGMCQWPHRGMEQFPDTGV